MGNIKYTKELLQEAVATSTNMSEVLRYLGAHPTGNTRPHLKQKILDFGISTAHFTRTSNFPAVTKKLDPKRFLIKTAPKKRTSGSLLKKAMLASGVDYRCSMETCDLQGLTVWGGKPLPFDVDHIDGDYTNNTLENLRFLCPNCHRLTETYGSQKREQNKCSQCEKAISKKAKKCSLCSNQDSAVVRAVEKTVYPDTAVIIKEIENKGYSKYAKELGISDNGLRKILKRRKVDPLPSKIFTKTKRVK